MSYSVETFPDFDYPHNLEEISVVPIHKQMSPVGYSQVRSKTVVEKKEFTILYKYLTRTQKETFEAFFEDNQGIVFDWQNPEPSGSIHSVIFTEDVLFFKWKYPANWEITFKIKEI